MSIISSLFGLNHFTNKDEDNKTDMEQFITISPKMFDLKFIIICVVIIGIFIIALIVSNRKKIYTFFLQLGKSNIKYLTSSTSPGFDLTFTPNN